MNEPNTTMVDDPQPNPPVEASTQPPSEPARVAFLTYLNRSGSTLLARLLDERADVAVSLESNVPDGIINRQGRLRGRADLPRFLDTAYADPKFCEWGVARSELEAALSPLAEIGFPDFLRAAMALSMGDRGARVHVFKVGRYWGRLPRVRSWFPDAKVLFVVRDLRGIQASQARSIDSRTGRAMSRFVGLTAAIYAEATRALLRHADPEFLLVVRYEDLLERPDAEIDRVLRFLGVSTTRRDGGSDYAERIPEAQRHLHTNVGGGAIQQRAEAWRSELTDEDAELLERVAGRALAHWGYAIEHPAAPSLAMRTKAWTAHLLHAVAHVNWWIRRRPWT